MKKQKKEATIKKSTKKKKRYIKRGVKGKTKKTSKLIQPVTITTQVTVLNPTDVTPPVRKRKLNYLNNRDILYQVALSKKQGKMTDTLALMLQTLCARYARRGNFVNYTYNDDMQSYAMVMLVKTWHSFNPEKSNNPFAFFTQCIKHSFIQYLNQEKRQRDVRDSIMVRNGMTPSFAYTAEHTEFDLQDDQEVIDYSEETTIPTEESSTPTPPAEEDHSEYELAHEESEIDLDNHDEGMIEEHLPEEEK